MLEESDSLWGLLPSGFCLCHLSPHKQSALRAMTALGGGKGHRSTPECDKASVQPTNKLMVFGRSHLLLQADLPTSSPQPSRPTGLFFHSQHCSYRPLWPLHPFVPLSSSYPFRHPGSLLHFISLSSTFLSSPFSQAHSPLSLSALTPTNLSLSPVSIPHLLHRAELGKHQSGTGLGMSPLRSPMPQRVSN